ncbi:MAG: DUF1566 domain-containing protein, partial [Anaerolineales bacterium]|nr:DUF1566 domain-containing protein [Anaerolineales bacterium]
MVRKQVWVCLLVLLVVVLTACAGGETAVSSPPSLGVQSAAAAETANTYLPTVMDNDEETLSVISPVVDTGQTTCYDSYGQVVACANSGQDGAYSGAQPSYSDNGDGTVTDNVTGLMWQQSPDIDGNGAINAADKLSYSDALAYAASLTLAGYDDWRLPTITELYALIDFNGVDPSGYNGTGTSGLTPFINTTYFDFGYGDVNAGERIIDAQYASSTLYVSTTMGGVETMFGVNFADGRIKGYGLALPNGEKTFYVIAVRGGSDYGRHDYVDNGDGTISDAVTGLTWMQADSGGGLNWDEAIAYCESSTLAGYDDWRLPNAKELQYLVDYGRSPDTTNSAAIDPLFSATSITNEAGQLDYAAYWSSTTHVNMTNGSNAAYVSFGRALGYMNGSWLDVHGAGAQRSDPKTGDPDDWPTGHGPQGDAIRIYNAVRCVRDDGATTTAA